MSIPHSALHILERKLGHTFADPQLLVTALTPSASGLRPNNQRLEFLGDTVLQFCVSRLLFQAHPDWSEGELTKLRGMIVCTAALREWAEDLELPLAKGPRSPRKAPPVGQRKPLADAMEALLAALFLDATAQGMDGWNPIHRLVEGRFAPFIHGASRDAWAIRDAKTSLQERAAQLGLPAPRYLELARSGPDHAPHFQVEVTVGSTADTGQGPSLKAAQTEAARRLLLRLGPVISTPDNLPSR